MWQRVTNVLRKIIICLIAIAGIGYTSSLLSRNSCESHRMSGILDSLRLPDGQMQPTFLLPTHGRRTEIVLKKAGVPVKHCLDEKSDCFPWVEVNSVVLPFIVAVKWEISDGALSGYGESALFFCLFGLRWPIQEESLWVS
jgi:hypothetical protein